MSALWKRLAEATRVKPGSKVELAKDFDPGRHDEQLRKDHGAAAQADAKAALLDLQDRFFAQADRSLLIIPCRRKLKQPRNVRQHHGTAARAFTAAA